MPTDIAPVLRSVLLAAAHVLSVLIAAPLLEGLVRKTTARIQSRQGPPITQPYLDLLKLLVKEDIESGEAPALQRLAAVLAPAAVLTVACLVPMGFGSPPATWADGVALIYVLTLCGAATVLAGLAAGSTYSLIGVSREVMAMILLEPLLAVAIVAASMRAGSLSLSAVFGGSIYSTPGAPWSGLLTMATVLLAFQALVQRTPYDTSEAETEIMEGPFMEYSGPKLALLKLAQMAKAPVYGAIFIGLFVPWVPWGDAAPPGWAWAITLPVFWLKLLGLVLLVTVVAATNARLRVDQAVRRYAALLATAMAALALAGLGF
jgi:formate hydrogenlyase subunit 4